MFTNKQIVNEAIRVWGAITTIHKFTTTHKFGKYRGDLWIDYNNKKYGKSVLISAKGKCIVVRVIAS